MQKNNLVVGIAVLGTVGKSVAKAIDAGIPGLTLGGVAARNKETATEWLSQLSKPVPVLSYEELATTCDVVVECAPSALLDEIATPVLKAGKTMVVLSSGGLLTRSYLVELAAQHGGRIQVPTGALLGLDAVCAAAEGHINSVRMITRKPVRGLVGAPFLEERKIDISGIESPLQIFNGTAREAAVGFPANLNVAVALSLAGVGPDETALEIWADPALTRNTHTIVVESDSARLQMTIENIPTENPKTGRITAQSVIATLRKMGAPLCIGT
ncbi:aspartate dehydrogenase [Pseudomonas asiatica]|uniref:aspartate dehydrogenase n=1 Tax=Pseudomonas asiatica TaxID=2219225 RepID=UPI0018ABC353|nr:aspartate dehydrogenase [Pseudomonas asiatica]MBF8803520.1 aspartate dehydrogenase [Pseudomonas asiatica]